MLQLRIVSMSGELYRGPIEQISLPTEQGMLTLLPGHVNLVTTLQSGNLSYIPQKTERSALESLTEKDATLSIQGGIVMIEDDVVTVAAE